MQNFSTLALELREEFEATDELMNSILSLLLPYTSILYVRAGQKSTKLNNGVSTQSLEVMNSNLPHFWAIQTVKIMVEPPYTLTCNFAQDAYNNFTPLEQAD